jgi:pimeloyl-ACP methyl ester carboxylesterase
VTAVQPQFIDVGVGANRRRIAYSWDLPPPSLTDEGGIFWLNGFMSDMTSTKASAVAAWAREASFGCTRFDYTGHGQSSGDLKSGTIGLWLEDALELFDKLTVGPQIVIGSSMGGYLALLMLKKLMRDNREEADRITGLVLIAPAWDMTEELMWKDMDEAQRRDLGEKGVIYQPSDYGDPYAITRELIEDGRKHLLARQTIIPARPVTVLQGLNDKDVPPAHTRALLTFLKGKEVKLVEVADGDHSLSRPQDIELLLSEIETLTA